MYLLCVCLALCERSNPQIYNLFKLLQSSSTKMHYPSAPLQKKSKTKQNKTNKNIDTETNSGLQQLQQKSRQSFFK